ncbi:hypothetical protein KSF78_0003847 [Schistosoma japonicum]|nr:hypothetical protein KSF78_0003847 [Schistosoma japonicum]KAH8867951.1 hypothetical protein KSF78_0003847 [Schistosoma japonicum]
MAQILHGAFCSSFLSLKIVTASIKLACIMNFLIYQVQNVHQITNQYFPFQLVHTILVKLNRIYG